MERIDQLVTSLQPYRKALTEHTLYKNLSSIADIRTFMEGHVYAVWDFMSLLKALQQKLTCLSTPWTPSQNPETARFINEIVLGEESDLSVEGKSMSHFEMYLEAMQQVNANTSTIQNFILSLEKGQPIHSSIDALAIAEGIKDFMRYTFSIIEDGKAHKIAAAFTFGREDVIPDMFLKIVEESGNESAYHKLTYYLNRHIELDGDEHGPLSLQMVEQLCGESEKKWEEATIIAQEALTKRIMLWDTLNEEIQKRKEVLAS